MPWEMIANMAMSSLMAVMVVYLRRIALVLDRIDGDVRRLDREVQRLDGRLHHVEAMMERRGHA